MKEEIPVSIGVIFHIRKKIASFYFFKEKDLHLSEIEKY